MLEKLEWEKIIDTFSNSDIYYLPSYLKPFQDNGDGEPFMYYYESNNGIVANVFLKRDIGLDKRFAGLISKDEYFDITTAYGYGGPLYEVKTDLELLKKEYSIAFSEYCIKNNIICEFTRFNPLIGNVYFSINDIETLHIRDTVSMDLTNGIEDIWLNLTSKNRNMIRKAEKNNIRIIKGLNGEFLTKFKDLYKKTMDRDNATEYYYFNENFFEVTVEQLNKNMMIFAAVYDEKIIATSIILFYKNYMHYHFSGSDNEFLRLSPNNLLLYEAAKWGSQNGYSKFHLGGGYLTKDDSLYKFKRSFSKKDSLKFYIGKKIYNQNIYNKLLKIRIKSDINFNKNTQFFPEYRG
jgi:hypothetical protein